MVDGEGENSMFLGQGKNGRLGLRGKLKKLIDEPVPLGVPMSKPWLADPNEVPYERKHLKYDPSDWVDVDPQHTTSGICWGLAIFRDRHVTQILLLDEVDINIGVFKRDGVANLSIERYSLLFGGAVEKDIEII